MCQQVILLVFPVGISARDPTVFPAWEVLRMATIEGAQAVGLGDEVGSLKASKQADLILVDLTELNLTPVLEAPVREPTAGRPPNLAYAGSGHEVKTMMVAGKLLVRDGRVLTADEATLRAEAQVQAEEVAQRVAADPVHKKMALLEAMEKRWL
jgi:5-methylthioadenosine/S-adenosylhomocysteine deaminase